MIIFALLMTITSYADNDHNATSYLKEPQLWQQGNDLWFLTMDMEWPLVVDNTEALPLQEYLTNFFFEEAGNSLNDCFTQFTKTKGTRLDSMPDGTFNRHYVEMTLQQLWHSEGRYITLYAYRQERLNDDSIIGTKHRYLTYDLIDGKLLSQGDIFNQRRLFGPFRDTYRVPFEDYLAATASVADEDYPYIDLTKQPNKIALVGDNVLFDLGGFPENNNISVVPIKEIEFVVSKEGRAFFKKPRLETNMDAETFDSLVFTPYERTALSDSGTWKQPSFPGGVGELNKFLKANTVYPDLDAHLRREGRVVASFIVEPDGRLSHIKVIKSVSPTLDRALVNMLRLMPRWEPGEIGGKKTPMRVSLPLTFSLGKQ